MGNEFHDFLPDEPQPGPSWARPDWRSASDDLTAALDPTQMQVAIKAAAANPLDPGKKLCEKCGAVIPVDGGLATTG